jgi:signal transduction histidine kinase
VFEQTNEFGEAGEKLASSGNSEMRQNWQEIYRAAVLETDHHKLANKIDLATAALGEVLREPSSGPEHSSEKQRITDALRTLDIIRRIELQISV